MVTRTTRAIQNSLEAKGFVMQDTHHKMLWYHLDGQRTSVRTRLSQGAKEYDDFLLGQMVKQLHLEKPLLLDLIDCPMSAETYREILLKGKHVAPPEADEKKVGKTKKRKMKK